MVPHRTKGRCAGKYGPYTRYHLSDAGDGVRRRATWAGAAGRCKDDDVGVVAKVLFAVFGILSVLSLIPDRSSPTRKKEEERSSTENEMK